MAAPDGTLRHLLSHAVDLLAAQHAPATRPLEASMPDIGIGEVGALDALAPHVLGRAAALGTPTSMAHMDPPTPWITWAATMWNAALNQNLLHPATAPAAREIEETVVGWLAPFFGMRGGHMLPGSTVANLTALWAARECAGVRRVVASDQAHLSVFKSAHLLGLEAHRVRTDPTGRLLASDLPADLSDSALVLTAGTTATGVVDPLACIGHAAWTHVDAAWAGPLRLSERHASVLAGIEAADSIAISAHKWLFQPKESALVLFRDVERAHAAISFGGAYLAAPNIGVLGSHGAIAVPLLATLMAWGRRGTAERIDRCMRAAATLADHVRGDARLRLLAEPETGVVVWRPVAEAADAFALRLPPGCVSLVTLAGDRWLRNVSANPDVDVEQVVDAIRGASARSA